MPIHKLEFFHDLKALELPETRKWMQETKSTKLYEPDITTFERDSKSSRIVKVSELGYPNRLALAKFRLATYETVSAANQPETTAQNPRFYVLT